MNPIRANRSPLKTLLKSEKTLKERAVQPGGGFEDIAIQLGFEIVKS
jgi:hypothetical protein